MLPIQKSVSDHGLIGIHMDLFLQLDYSKRNWLPPLTLPGAGNGYYTLELRATNPNFEPSASVQRKLQANFQGHSQCLVGFFFLE